jgi:hypothetical protein
VSQTVIIQQRISDPERGTDVFFYEECDILLGVVVPEVNTVMSFQCSSDKMFLSTACNEYLADKRLLVK